MANLKIYEYFNKTGQEIIRDLDADEMAQKELDAQNYQELKDKRAAELAAKTTARTALLNRLGITEDEAKLLLA